VEGTRLILPIVLVAVGTVWIAQGLGFLQGSSFMVGDARWAAAGVVVAMVGAWLGWHRRRGRRGAD
jgi:hypothetical protein